MASTTGKRNMWEKESQVYLRVYARLYMRMCVSVCECLEVNINGVNILH
jgi:hypothetical protein